MKEVHCVVRCIVLCVRTHRRNPNHPNRPPMQLPPIPSNPQMHTFSPILHNSHITLLDTTQFTHYTPGYTRATRCHYACHTMHATFLRMPLFSTACHSPHNTLLHSPHNTLRHLSVCCVNPLKNLVEAVCHLYLIKCPKGSVYQKQMRRGRRKMIEDESIPCLRKHQKDLAG